jgi:hypothetical protein
MGSMLEFQDADYYQNAVIQPPKDFTFVENDNKTARIVIDSRVRDKGLFPNPNSYEIVFEDDINDVKQCRLLYIDIPMPQYLVNSNYNTLYFSVGLTSYVATIPLGDYTSTSLATAVTTAMNVALPATFEVSYNSLLDNYAFNSTVAFTLLFNGKTNPLSSLLGFSEKKDYASSADPSTPLFPNKVSAEFRRHFDYNNYVIMDIEQFDILKSIDRDLNKSFAIIPKNYSTMSLWDEQGIVKNFSPPLGRLTKLRIKFYDRYGNPYDFQNMDHRFELLFTSFKQRRKYTH